MPDDAQIAAVKKAGGNLDNPAYAATRDPRDQFQKDPGRITDPTVQPPRPEIGQTYFDTDQEA